MLRSNTVLFIIYFISILNIKSSAQSANPDTADLQLLKQISSLRSDLAQIRHKRFERLTLADRDKVSGIIEELFNRAEQKVLNTLPAGKFEWSWSGFDTPKDMVAQGEDFLKTLSMGADPFEGKFAEPGCYTVDHALIEKDGIYHLIYIRGCAATNWPEYPLFNFGHAVSRDLITWQIEKPVLQCPLSGVDEYQVWAPYILKYKNQYWMFYAGVNNNVCQSICLATSKDLYNWQRYEKSPVITTGPWGLWDKNQWSDCRDPMVLQDGDNFYCYYAAGRINPETQKHEYCLGISSSKDLLTWKDEGFIRLEKSLDTPPESPFAVKHNEKYYIFYTNYKYGTTYITSNNPIKNWHELPVDKMSVIPEVSASEILETKGKWYITLISHIKNGLHFFEIRDLIWNVDGTVSVKPFNK
jgi:hypothetical protein